MVRLIRLILGALLTITPLTAFASASFAVVWFVLARHGVVADVREIRLFLIGDLLFLLLAAYVVETASRTHPDSAENKPHVLETLAVAIGALPILLQNTVGAALFLDWKQTLQFDWRPLTVRFEDIPNLFAAILWGVLSLRQSPWYVLALIIVLCVTVYLSICTARAANFARDGKPIKSAVSIYALSVALYTLNGLFIKTHMTIEGVVPFTGITIGERLAIVAVGFLTVMSCVATAWGFRRAMSLARSLDGRLVFLMGYAALVVVASAGSLWLVWFFAEKLPGLAVISHHAGVPTLERLSFDWRFPTVTLGGIVALMLLGALWRSDAWAVAGRVIRKTIRAAIGLCLQSAITIGRAANASRTLLALCLALSLLGSSGGHAVITAPIEVPVQNGPPPPPPAPRVSFRETEVDCRSASWMVRQTDRVSVSLGMCFPLEEADYFVAIGDATATGTRRTEETRAFERAKALAEAVAAGHPALSGRVFALNAGITSHSSNRFEANPIHALIASAPTGAVRLTDAQFLDQLREYLRTTGIGPHSSCRLYRLIAEETETRLVEIKNVSCKPSP